MKTAKIVKTLSLSLYLFSYTPSHVLGKQAQIVMPKAEQKSSFGQYLSEHKTQIGAGVGISALLFYAGLKAYHMDNFYVVEEGKLYRANQLSYEKELQVLRKHNIGLIINLRGYHPEMSWCASQTKAAKASGIPVIYASTSGRSFPSMHSLLIMLATIHNTRTVVENPREVERDPLSFVLDPSRSTFDRLGNPIAIKVNCFMGADRTGMFSALYKIERGLKPGMSEQEKEELIKKARGQLSIRYRHLKPLFYAMDNFIEYWWKLRKNRSLAEAIAAYGEYEPKNSSVFGNIYATAN